MDNGVWGEHEYDFVFTGNYEGPINPDPEEIADYKWIEIKNLIFSFQNKINDFL